MLRLDIFFRMMTGSTYQTNLGERDVCLLVRVHLKIYQVEDEEMPRQPP